MAFNKPFHRNWRGIKSGPNSGYSGWAYIVDREYARSPGHYTRAFMLIQQDLEKLFQFIEPSPESLSTFSYRLHELLMRTCIEIEANFKAILNENTFTPKTNSYGAPILNIPIYKKIDVTHHLSSYEVILPIWNGPRRVLAPFAPWKSDGSLSWYQAYNASKHDRLDEFRKANLENVLDAVAALLILLSSQFRTEDFSSGATSLTLKGNDYHEMASAIGGLFRIKFADDWSDDDIYDFNWSNLEGQPSRFEKINYDII